MQATITYNLTAETQRALIAATGQPVPVKQTHTIDIPAEDLDFVQIHEDGTLTRDLTNWKASQTTPEEVWGEYKAALTRKRAEEEQEKRKAKEDLYQRTLRVLEHRETKMSSVYRGDARYEIQVPAWPYDSDKEVTESPAALAWTKELDEQNEAHIAQQMAARAAKKAADEQKEAAKLAYIAEWLAKNRDPLIQEQFREGLLPRDTVLGWIADQAFDELPEYKRETCDNLDCPCGTIKTTGISPASYRTWRGLRTKLPAGSTYVFGAAIDHRDVPERDDLLALRELNEPSAPKPRYYAELKVPVGPFTFERTVELPPAAE